MHIILKRLWTRINEPISVRNAEGNSENNEVAFFEERLVTDLQHIVTKRDHASGDTKLGKNEMFSALVEFEPISDEFWSEWISSGVQINLLGQKQTGANAPQVGNEVGVHENVQRIKKLFRISDVNHAYFGLLKLLTPLADDILITFEA